MLTNLYSRHFCHLCMNLCFLILNNLLEKERENRVENGEHLVRSRCPRVVRSDHGADGDALLQKFRNDVPMIKTPSLMNKFFFLYCHHPLQIHYSSPHTHIDKATQSSHVEWKIKILTWTLIVSVSPL